MGTSAQIDKAKLLNWIYNGHASGFTVGELTSLINLGYFDFKPTDVYDKEEASYAQLRAKSLSHTASDRCIVACHTCRTRSIIPGCNAEENEKVFKIFSDNFHEGHDTVSGPKASGTLLDFIINGYAFRDLTGCWHPAAAKVTKAYDENDEGNKALELLRKSEGLA